MSSSINRCKPIFWKMPKDLSFSEHGNNMSHLTLTGKALLLVVFTLVVAVWTSTSVAQVNRVKAEGKLTSIEIGDNVTRVIIDDKYGYEVAPDARIMRKNGKVIKLEELHIPTRVQFEYVYTSSAPMIRKIKEIPQ